MYYIIWITVTLNNGECASLMVWVIGQCGKAFIITKNSEKLFIRLLLKETSLNDFINSGKQWLK